MLPVKNWTLAIAVLCVMAVAGLAQPPQRQAPDRLGRLKAALAEAGAPELSSTQVTQLEAAIKAFRHQRNVLQVGQKHALGLVVGVADVVADLATLTGQFANTGHG